MSVINSRVLVSLLALAFLLGSPQVEGSPRAQSCSYETLSGTKTIDTYMDWFVQLASKHAQYQDADSDWVRGVMRESGKTLVNECPSYYERLRDGEEPWSGSISKEILERALEQSDLDPDAIFRDVRQWARELRERD